MGGSQTGLKTTYTNKKTKEIVSEVNKGNWWVLIFKS